MPVLKSSSCFLIDYSVGKVFVFLFTLFKEVVPRWIECTYCTCIFSSEFCFFLFVCFYVGWITSLSNILLSLVVSSMMLLLLVWVLLCWCHHIVLCSILYVYQIPVLSLVSISYQIICIWMYHGGKVWLFYLLLLFLLWLACTLVSCFGHTSVLFVCARFLRVLITLCWILIHSCRNMRNFLYVWIGTHPWSSVSLPIKNFNSLI